MTSNRLVAPLRPPYNPRQFQYAVCGFGPAGSGFLLHAWKTGLLAQMARDGLVVIDRAETLGAGAVGQYLLTGNSLSSAFTDCIDDPGYAPLFDDLKMYDPSVRALRAIAHQAPPLDITATFLETMVERFAHYIEAEHGVKILRCTDVASITSCVGGGFQIAVRDRLTGEEGTIGAHQLISAFGGRQAPEVVASNPLAPGLTLAPWRDRLFMSDAFLRLHDDEIRAAISAGAIDDVVVVGSSHSAMSALDRLTDALRPLGLKRLTVLHRTPLRLYYETAEAARQDGYPFDEVRDICPITQRVNRFSGLRYRSFAVGQSLLRTGRMPDQPVTVRMLRLNEPANQPEILQALDRAPSIVTCLGYQANLPAMSFCDRRTVKLRNGPTGLEVDELGQALQTDGSPLAGFYCIGLGSKVLRRSETIGGELSFTGQADGVWLYQNHGAIPVSRAIAAQRMAAAELEEAVLAGD